MSGLFKPFKDMTSRWSEDKLMRSPKGNKLALLSRAKARVHLVNRPELSAYKSGLLQLIKDLELGIANTDLNAFKNYRRDFPAEKPACESGDTMLSRQIEDLNGAEELVKKFVDFEFARLVKTRKSKSAKAVSLHTQLPSLKTAPRTLVYFLNSYVDLVLNEQNLFEITMQSRSKIEELSQFDSLVIREHLYDSAIKLERLKMLVTETMQSMMDNREAEAASLAFLDSFEDLLCIKQNMNCYLCHYIDYLQGYVDDSLSAVYPSDESFDACIRFAMTQYRNTLVNLQETKLGSSLSKDFWQASMSGHDLMEEIFSKQSHELTEDTEVYIHLIARMQNSLNQDYDGTLVDLDEYGQILKSLEQMGLDDVLLPLQEIVSSLKNLLISQRHNDSIDNEKKEYLQNAAAGFPQWVKTTIKDWINPTYLGEYHLNA